MRTDFLRRRMRLVCCALGALLLAGAPLEAQRQVPEHRFALDVGALSASLSYANRVRGDWYGGVGAGAGGDLVNWMALGGRHFAESGGFAYQERDPYGGELLFELLHANLFARYEPARRWQADVGLRASVFLHFDDSDDDPGGGFFTGAYGSFHWGWRSLKVGPRVIAGVFAEQLGEGEYLRELGVNVAPLTVRLTFP